MRKIECGASFRPLMGAKTFAAVCGLAIGSIEMVMAQGTAPGNPAAPPPGPQLPITGGNQWGSFNNRLDGQRFSPLKEITPANASELSEVCRIQIDGPTAFGAGLVVVDGLIYTNTGRQTVAIDATNCALRWKSTYTPDDEELRQSSRGPAVLDGRVFRGTGDGRLLALDASTGRLLWKDAIGVPRLSEFASAAPLAWQGVVYMGIGGGDAGIRGRVMAFDAATGRELWRFDTVPMGKEFGADTWKRAKAAKTGGGGVWGAMTLDAASGELVVSVGNPWPDIDADWRPGANLFTNSIVVLDAHTGALKWWHQAVSADRHDLDLTAAAVLYRNSQIQDVLAFGGKDGYVVALDRDTHKVLFRTPVTHIENPGARATQEGTHVCPGFAGGVQWNGPTLDRLNNSLVTGAVEWCMTLVSAPTVYAPPKVAYGGFPKPDPTATGSVTSLDADTGTVRWRYEAEKPVVAGVTPSAGGVTFAGDLAGNLLVLDSKTGVLVHKETTGGALAGGVVTYDVGGRQYVAVASGNVSRAGFGALGLPSVVVMAINGKSLLSAPNLIGAATATTAGSGTDGGHELFVQICASCHGTDGDMIGDHKLSTLASRRDLAATIAYIKNPQPPMPKMFPDVLTEQNILDVSTYLQQGVGR